MADTKPKVRIDAMTVLASGFSAILVIGTLKIIAYKHHQHPLAQGFLVLF